MKCSLNSGNYAPLNHSVEFQEVKRCPLTVFNRTQTIIMLKAVLAVTYKRLTAVRSLPDHCLSIQGFAVANCFPVGFI